eukprot:360997-Chlamydomonas_euryale.AAC.4
MPYPHLEGVGGAPGNKQAVRCHKRRMQPRAANASLCICSPGKHTPACTHAVLDTTRQPAHMPSWTPHASLGTVRTQSEDPDMAPVGRPHQGQDAHP